MKLIIAGGRDYKFSVGDFVLLNQIHRRYRVTEVITGKARGADWYGEYWAYESRSPSRHSPPIGRLMAGRQGQCAIGRWRATLTL